ncbi:MAG: exopolysaccharide biosynthesis protein [Acetobacteraceae bacterium]
MQNSRPMQPHPPLPTSVVLGQLIRESPGERVNLAWLTGRLGARAFGFVLLLLGICGLLPVVSPAAGLLLTVPAFQMIRAYPAPSFPQRIAQRSIPTDKVVAMIRRVIPPLHFLERFVRPRWITPFQTTKRIIGGFVLALGACLLVPVPFSNVPVSLTVMLMAFAHLEEDGIVLGGAMLIALVILATGAATAWSLVAGVVWLVA